MTSRRGAIFVAITMVVLSLTPSAHAGDYDIITPGECEDAGGKVEPIGGGFGRCVDGELAGHLVSGVQ